MAQTEYYANNAKTTLTANYVAGSGSITVTSTAGNFPSSVPFHVCIYDETATPSSLKVILEVTAITDSTHFAVTAEGSDANAASGCIVYQSLTKVAIDRIKADCVSNSAITLTDPTSSTWNHAFNTTGMIVTPTYDSTNHRWAMTSKDAAGSVNQQGIATAIPSAPYVKYFRITPLIRPSAAGYVGIGWADGSVGSPGKTAILLINNGGGTLAGNFNSTTSYNGGITLTTGMSHFYNFSNLVPVWVRLTDNSTTWTLEVSYDYDGKVGHGKWISIFSETRNTFLTATQFIICVDDNSASSNTSVGCFFDSYGDS